jgi:hypothetical protein
MQPQNVKPAQEENELHAADTLLIDSNVVEAAAYDKQTARELPA